ncbi:hypothetical protein TNCV_3605931 [Trichonephila clavipes]|uniref:Uncharacterized protein n=1 Tax=Trichonephila clavipes TaxID=2585209 RepID=A0A8X6RM69_TRICX|nr:hypothetical protein TNCV_3605931 [Trichonephila clavipes]
MPCSSQGIGFPGPTQTRKTIIQMKARQTLSGHFKRLGGRRLSIAALTHAGILDHWATAALSIHERETADEKVAAIAERSLARRYSCQIVGSDPGATKDLPWRGAGVQGSKFSHWYDVEAWSV